MTSVEPQPDAPPPERRWFQYSLRSLLLLTLLCAVACSWYVDRRRVAAARKEYDRTDVERSIELKTDLDVLAASKRLCEAEEASYLCDPVHARARHLIRVDYLERNAWARIEVTLYDEGGHEEAVKQATHLTRCREEAIERLEEALENR